MQKLSERPLRNLPFVATMLATLLQNARAIPLCLLAATPASIFSREKSQPASWQNLFVLQKSLSSRETQSPRPKPRASQGNRCGVVERGRWHGLHRSSIAKLPSVNKKSRLVNLKWKRALSLNGLARIHVVTRLARLADQQRCTGNPQRNRETAQGILENGIVLCGSFFSGIDQSPNFLERKAGERSQ